MKDPLIDLFYQAENYFFRAISKECLVFNDRVTAYLTGVDSEGLNVVYIKRKMEGFDATLQRCKRFFETNHAPWTVIISEEQVTNETVDSLKNIGFILSGKTAGMVLELTKEVPYANTTDGVIRAVNDKLGDWMQPLVEAYKSTETITRQYMACHEKALKQQASFRHYTLYKEELPISSLTLSLQSASARIDDVATLPAYQNKGYATQLMKYAMNEALKFGVTHCFLEASESGNSVYQKLGFKPLFINQTFARVGQHAA